MKDLRGKRPEITYPAPWEYTVIGRDEARLREAIAQVVGEKPAQIALSNTSTHNKYVSLKVSLTVDSEAERVSFFEQLRDHADTVLVL